MTSFTKTSAVVSRTIYLSPVPVMAEAGEYEQSQYEALKRS